MISAILFFFGTTLIYTGFLASARDQVAGIAVACVGFVLIIKPALDAFRRFRTHSRGGTRPHGGRILQKVRPRKVYLKIVKSEDDKPTIH